MSRATLRVGWLLGKRQIQRTSRWTTGLIIFIMTITFLNLLVVSGILEGLIVGGNEANRSQYTGDVIVLTPGGESSIERSQSLIATLATFPEVDRYSERFIEGGQIEANYRTRRDPNAARDLAGTQITGIDPVKEDAATNLSDYVVEGEYLEEGEEGFVLLGANLLRRYSQNFGDSFASLDEVYPGDKVRILAGEVTKEMTVKGIVQSKVGEVSIRAFINDSEFKRLFNRTDLNANEISIFLTSDSDPVSLKKGLIASGFTEADIRTASEAIPQFLEDIRIAFALLGNVIGGIGLLVAIITIFIIVFINAITRRKYIGILKAIGVKGSAIELGYVIQALFYAVVGALLGALILHLLLQPFVAAHPINFPFSDGILVAPPGRTLGRFILLIITTAIAGFIPARMIIKRNTLDAILGR